MCALGQSVRLVEATLPKQGNGLLYLHFTKDCETVVVGAKGTEPCQCEPKSHLSKHFILTVCYVQKKIPKKSGFISGYTGLLYIPQTYSPLH